MDTPAAFTERHPQCLVLDCVPPEADPQADPAVGQQIDLGGLLGDERGLPLGQENHAGHKFQARARGEVAEHDDGSSDVVWMS